MSALNRRTSPQFTAVSTNGNAQFTKSPEQILIEIVTSFMYGGNYSDRTNAAIMASYDQALNAVVRNRNFNFIANLAYVARTDYGMRSMPIKIAVDTLRIARQLSIPAPAFSRKMFTAIIQRADELANTYQYALSVFGDKKNVPLAIKKGVGDAFNKFDEYQLGKYLRKGSEMSMSDLMRIVHPVPVNEEKSALFASVIQNTIPAPLTWEVMFSENGKLPANQRARDADIWKYLMDERKLGYMAMLRNLRNISQTNDIATYEQAISNLLNPGFVRSSKVMPMDIYKALLVTGEQRLWQALELSIGNIEVLGDNPAILIDWSGSMNDTYGFKTLSLKHGVTWKSKCDFDVSQKHVAALMGAVLFRLYAQRGVEPVIIKFATAAKIVRPDRNATIKQVFDYICYPDSIGHSTNLGAGLQLLNGSNDVIYVNSDMQVNELSGYDRQVLNNGRLRKVAFNLAFYPDTPVGRENGWYQLSGMSSGTFTTLAHIFEADNGDSIINALSGDPLFNQG